MQTGFSNLALRIAVTVVFGPALLALFWFGGLPHLVGMILVVALGTREYCHLQTRRGFRAYASAGMLAAGGWCTAAYFYGPARPELILIGAVIGVAVFSRRTGEMEGARTTLRGAVYVGYLGSFALLVRDLGGPEITALVLFGIWATDTFAFFSGRRFGRRHPFPRLSPRKTDAGFVGGMVGALMICAGGALYFDLLRPGSALVLGVLVGAGGLAGDLAESKLKRDAGVKDSSRLIPGHGGVLGREIQQNH